MKFSLIVGTYDNYTDLPHLFDSLLSQTHKDFEVIVIDQNPDPAIIRHQCDEYTHALDIRYIHIDEQGLSVARNFGIRCAVGDVYCFPDDDCTYAPTTLEDVNTAFLENNTCEIISISARNPQSKALLSYTPISKTRFITEQSFIFPLVTSIGLFVRKNEFLFDPQFGVGAQYPSCEEFDYVLRLLKAKYRGKYLPDIHVFHNEVNTAPAEYARKIYKNSIGHGAFYKKHFHHTPLSWVHIRYFFNLFIKPLIGILYYALLFNRPGTTRQINYLRGRIKGYMQYTSN